MENPNRMALDLVDEAIDFDDELRVGVRHLANDAAVLDFGVDHPGGIEAGLLLAEVATGGLATVQSRVGTAAGGARTHVEVATDHPTLSLLGCQSPSWAFDADGAIIRGYGPAQLFRRDHPLADRLDPDEGAGFAVLAVEAERLPGEALVEAVAGEAGVPTSSVFVLAAPAGSVAGSVAFAARVAVGAVVRLEAAGIEPGAVRTIAASAPVAPIARAEAEARSRSAGAIAAGGRAHAVVDGGGPDPDRLVGGGESPDDPAPAQLTVDVVDGPTHVVGDVAPDRLADVLGA